MKQSTSEPRLSTYLLFPVFVVPILAGWWLAFLVSHECTALPLDDAYILGKYSLNLAKGNGFSFNAGETSFGSTSFLFPILVSIPLKFYRALNFELIAHIYGKISFLLLILLVEVWVWRITRDALITLLAGLLTALSPMGFMNAVSGMETTTFTLALVGAFAIYTLSCLQKPFFLGLVGGTSVLFRPEGFIVLAIPIFDFIRNIIEKNKQPFRKYLVFSVAFAVFVIPYLVAVKTTTDNWLPTTYRGKIISTDPFMHENGLLRDILWGLVFLFKGHWRTFAQWGISGIFVWSIMACGIAFLIAEMIQRNTPPSSETEKKTKFIFPMLLLSAVAAAATCATFSSHTLLKVPLALAIVLLALSWFILLKKTAKSSLVTNIFIPFPTKAIVWVIILLLPFAYGALFRAGPVFGGYYNRYIMPMLPAGVILFSTGLVTVFRYFQVKKPLKIICLFFFVSYPLLVTGIQLPHHKAVCKRECSLNNGIRRQAGEWIRNNTPPTAVIFTGYTGLGVVGFYADRRILDMGALINPDIFEYYRDVPAMGAARWERTIKYMLDKKVDYFVTAPGIEGEPSSDPTGLPGFEQVVSFTAPNEDSPLKTITVWKVDREKIKASLKNLAQ